MKIEKYLKEKAQLINDALKEYMPSEEEYPQTIHTAMYYSAMAPGKRLRPVLVIAAAEAVGGDEMDVLPFACAIELIHTYSLVHDDLPAMDNSDLRRGMKTNHKVFGEALAILAGDALLTHAFNLMSKPASTVDPKIQLSLIHEISHSIGTFGLIGGQVVDIQSKNKTATLDLVDYMHTHKTGALIRASLRTGAILGGGTDREINALSIFAEKIGLAFQIIDDILDEEGSQEIVGKSVGSDKDANKPTYPSVVGMEESKNKAKTLVEEGIKELDILGKKGEYLRGIAIYMVERNK